MRMFGQGLYVAWPAADDHQTTVTTGTTDSRECNYIHPSGTIECR